MDLEQSEQQYEEGEEVEEAVLGHGNSHPIIDN